VRKAHEEHILHPELFGPLAEIAQRLLIFRAQLQGFDLTLAGLHFRDDLKGLGQRIAGPAHGQLIFGSPAPDVRLDPGVMVLFQAEKIGRLLVFRHAVCDRLHLVARHRDVIEPFVQAGVRFVLIEVVQKAVDLHDDDFRRLPAHGFGEHGVIQA